jgi:hypothetical protein
MVVERLVADLAVCSSPPPTIYPSTRTNSGGQFATFRPDDHLHVPSGKVLTDRKPCERRFFRASMLKIFDINALVGKTLGRESFYFIIGLPWWIACMLS